MVDVLIECGGLCVCEMNEAAARDIAEWHYPEEYAMYDFSGYDEEEEQLFNGLHFSVYDGGVLVGFVSVGPAAQVACRGSKEFYEDESFTDIGVGLKPVLCGMGNGLGLSLVNAAIAFVKSEFPDDGVRLTVDSDNLRARKVYEKAGFVPCGEFSKTVTVYGKKHRRKFIVYKKEKN